MARYRRARCALAADRPLQDCDSCSAEGTRGRERRSIVGCGRGRGEIKHNSSENGSGARLRLSASSFDASRSTARGRILSNDRVIRTSLLPRYGYSNDKVLPDTGSWRIRCLPRYRRRTFSFLRRRTDGDATPRQFLPAELPARNGRFISIEPRARALTLFSPILSFSLFYYSCNLVS